MDSASVDTNMKFLNKVKIELSYDSATPLLGIYPKEMKTGHQRYICTAMLTTALFAISKIRKQLKWSSVNKCIKEI